MGLERTSAGLDVHARSVSAAAIDGVTGELVKQRLVPGQRVITDWLHNLPGPVAVTYEAGPTGFGLARALSSAGIRCVVAARRRSTARPGTGSRPTPETRCCWPDCCGWTTSSGCGWDLVRAREDARVDLMRS